jgi:glucosamine 6-phosphate synthetase-like amidotransferase/phosphosugar isomerase protein
MCGIAGSNNREVAFKLYQSNLNRGYYSSGSLLINIDKQYSINKTLGVFDKPVGALSSTDKLSESKYYFYHSRGPTVVTTGYIPENNHPFTYGDWIVAHNGIISNFKQLCEKYFPEENFEGTTDSCIIPRMLEVKSTVKKALETLEGTFALWMYNKRHNVTYLARSSCTLFGSNLRGDFSSTEFEGSVPLKEGIIYSLYDYCCIVQAATFSSNSPYFII